MKLHNSASCISDGLSIINKDDAMQDEINIGDIKVYYPGKKIKVMEYEGKTTSMDIQSLKKEKDRLNGKLSWIDNVIREYIGGRYEDMGLVSDEVKTPTFSALNRERSIIFEELRQFNGKYAKIIHKLNA